jgi:hypothetical protein
MAMKHTFTMMDENGDEREIDLPVKMEVCPDCDGHGVHVSPAIDGNGLSSEDFDQDPDFREAYFSGQYDVRCEVCKGLRVVPEVDRAHADPDDLKLYDECREVSVENARFERECRRERDAERRMGA